MTCMNCGTPLITGAKFCPQCGTPAAQPTAAPPPYAPPAGRMQTSWDAAERYAPSRRKSRVGRVLLIIFAVLVLLGGVAAVAVYYGYKYVESSLKNSEAYRVAVEELKRSEVAARHLGEIEETGFPIGSFNESAGGTGNAAFTMSVEGTKGSGQYVVTLERAGGAWKVESAFLRLTGGEMLDLGKGSAGAVGGGGQTGEANSNVGAQNSGPPFTGKTVSGGVLNGKAVSKPVPPYPKIAKAARAEGTVTVQVTVDEQGRVVSATPVSGHPLLQQAAAAAARQARFTPTLLAGKPVRVTGLLTYDFKLE